MAEYAAAAAAKAKEEAEAKEWCLSLTKDLFGISQIKDIDEFSLFNINIAK